MSGKEYIAHGLLLQVYVGCVCGGEGCVCGGVGTWGGGWVSVFVCLCLCAVINGQYSLPQGSVTNRPGV